MFVAIDDLPKPLLLRLFYQNQVVTVFWLRLGSWFTVPRYTTSYASNFETSSGCAIMLPVIRITFTNLGWSEFHFPYLHRHFPLILNFVAHVYIKSLNTFCDFYVTDWKVCLTLFIIDQFAPNKPSNRRRNKNDQNYTQSCG